MLLQDYIKKDFSDGHQYMNKIFDYDPYHGKQKILYLKFSINNIIYERYLDENDTIYIH